MEVVFTPPVKLLGASERGATPCPWSCPCAGARAARLRRGALGTPVGSARTVGAMLSDFLTEAIASGMRTRGRPAYSRSQTVQPLLLPLVNPWDLVPKPAVSPALSHE